MVGARVILEWPDRCMYWDDEDYVEFFKKYGFSFVKFDGCMYGLIAAFGKGKGLPIRKPWRIALVNTCLPEFLNKRCDGNHEHTPCEGENTLYSQGYTPQIVKAIHQAINEDIRRLDSSGKKDGNNKSNFVR